MSTSFSPIKLSPFYAETQKLGAQFIERDGWRTPGQYVHSDGLVAARERVAIADNTSNGRIFIEGQAADAVLEQVLVFPSLEIGTGAPCTLGLVFRLRPDLFLVNTSPDKAGSAFETLSSIARASKQFITVTDMSDAFADIFLVGPSSRDLLGKLCMLDLQLGAWPNLAAKQTMVAKSKQIIIRCDLGHLPSFSLIGARSLGVYLWDMVMQAGREWSIAPIGISDLEKLERE